MNDILAKIKIAKSVNILGKFCGKRDLSALTQQNLLDNLGIIQADVMVLFGASILSGGDLLAKGMKDRIAQKYMLVGGAGHTTEFLRQQIHHVYPDIDTGGLPEAQLFSVYLHRKYGLTPDLLECDSTNCGNNITNMLQLLEKNHIPYQNVILAQDATMQRRMDAGFRKYAPGDKRVINYATYSAKIVINKQGNLTYESKIPGMWSITQYISLLMCEIPRLTDDENGYGPCGKDFIAHVDIPDFVKNAYLFLYEQMPELIRSY